MTGYHAIINEATGIEDRPSLERVEDWMRNIIFHSTLDWQSRSELHAAARVAASDLTAYALSGL